MHSDKSWFCHHLIAAYTCIYASQYFSYLIHCFCCFLHCIDKRIKWSCQCYVDGVTHWNSSWSCRAWRARLSLTTKNSHCQRSTIICTSCTLLNVALLHCVFGYYACVCGHAIHVMHRGALPAGLVYHLSHLFLKCQGGPLNANTETDEDSEPHTVHTHT